MESNAAKAQCIAITSDDLNGRLVSCHPDDLRPHSSYARHCLAVSVSILSGLAECGDLAFREPLAITQDGTILDGYAQWELARLQKRLTLRCIEYELSEAEALQWLIHRHRRSSGLNDFNRILLALDLEPWFREKARSNQQIGGQQKGSSKLTEADRLDVRSEVAATAGVSVGNISKVKQVIASAHSHLVDALRNGEISIHRAWIWTKRAPKEQCEALSVFRRQKGLKKAIRKLVSKHNPTQAQFLPDLGDLARRLVALETSKLASVGFTIFKGPGKSICVTEELLQLLQLRQRDICATSNQ